ncbi:MAG: hypothetical protein AAF713_05165 [Pseudomonadota bacterium]
MTMMRFSAAPAGPLGDLNAPWAVFGERAGDPDGLEGTALAGVNLAQIASSPGAPMFETESLFGAHMAGLDLKLNPDEPAVVFVHGLGYEPRRPVVARFKSDNAHRCLYHFTETPEGPGSWEERRLRLTPWFARALVDGGRGAEEDAHGLAVGFCYTAGGGAADLCRPSWRARAQAALGLVPPWARVPAGFGRAYRDAEQAGYGLAAVLRQVAARLDHGGMRQKRIDLICHGLGARVMFAALALLAQRCPDDWTLARIDRVIVLGGLAYWGQAAHGLANILFSEVAPRPNFYNVTARQDDVLTWLETRSMLDSARREAAEDLTLDAEQRRMLRRGRMIGRSGKPPAALYNFFGPDYPEWVDIALDNDGVRAWGKTHGLDLRGRRRFSFGDHGLSFTHPGNWGLYRKILRERRGWSAQELATRLVKL